MSRKGYCCSRSSWSLICCSIQVAEENARKKREAEEKEKARRQKEEADKERVRKQKEDEARRRAEEEARQRDEEARRQKEEDEKARKEFEEQKKREAKVEEEKKKCALRAIPRMRLPIALRSLPSYLEIADAWIGNARRRIASGDRRSRSARRRSDCGPRRRRGRRRRSAHGALRQCTVYALAIIHTIAIRAGSRPAKRGLPQLDPQALQKAAIEGAKDPNKPATPRATLDQRYRHRVANMKTKIALIRGLIQVLRPLFSRSPHRLIPAAD